MEIQGKIIAALPPRSGVSAKGTQWQVNTYVLETADRYPKRMAFEVFGADKAAQFNIQIGEELKVNFDIDANEYQDRWFNQIRAWKVERPYLGQALQSAPQQSAFQNAFPPQQQQTAQPPQQQQSAKGAPAGGTDDLPF